jgi:hypothetical protein
MHSLIKHYRGKVVDSPRDNVLAVLIVKGMVFTFKDGLRVVSVGIGIRMVYVYESILIGVAVSILYLIENLTVSLFS